LIDYSKKYNAQVKDPVHLNAFILAYSRVIMNRCINAFDGFTDWNKTFYYTDTDSIYIHINQLKELQRKMPDIIGKNLGNLHDDIKEVEGGKIIRAIFIRPKL
jgi:hypothetical protein